MALILIGTSLVAGFWLLKRFLDMEKRKQEKPNRVWEKCEKGIDPVTELRAKGYL